MRFFDSIFDKTVDNKVFDNIVDYLKSGSGTQSKKNIQKPKHAAKNGNCTKNIVDHAGITAGHCCTRGHHAAARG